MPTDKIDLKSSLEDSPQVQAQISRLEGNIAPMKDCTVLLRDTFQACSVHQLKVCEGTETLTKLLKSFQEDALSEDDSFLSGSFSRIGRYLNELHSCQDMLSSQLQNAVIELLSQFISNEFSDIEKVKESFESAWHDHDQATIKYSRVSRKKDSDKTRFEANADLFTARKKYYDSCLDYYTKLNGFKLKWKYSLMEPLLTYMHAQMSYFKAGHEVLNKELGKVLNELNTEAQKFHNQYQSDMAAMAEEREEIELSFPGLCLPDPDPNDPFVDYHPPKTIISSKNGYLFLRGQKTGFGSQWDRGYFFTKKGQLFSHFPQRNAEPLFTLKGADASPGEMDDRRYVLQVTHSSHKRPFYLMAENEVEKDEWIATINNNRQERSSHQPNSAGDAEFIKQKREEIRSWVNKEIRPPKIRDRANTTRPTRSNTSSAPNLPLIKPVKSPTRSPVLPRVFKPKKQDPTSGPYPLSPSPSSLGQLPTPLQPEKVLAVSVPPSQSTPAVVSSGKFSVKYLGHTEIKDGKAPTVITDTIRKVMAARSVQNVKSAIDIEMTVATKSIVFMDVEAKKAIGQIQLKGVVRCSTHPDNLKLLGVVNQSNADADKTRYICHVLESEFESSQICKVVDNAVRAALNSHMSLPPKQSPHGSSQPSSQPSMGYSGQAPMVPRRPPPPIFKPTYNASGYVTFDNDQVVAANASRSTASTAMQNTSSAPNLTNRSSRQQTLPPQPSSSSSNSGDLFSKDNVTSQGKPPPENKFTDNFTTQDSDRYSPDLDDLPPLDSPPPSIGTHTTDSSYISDSSFTVTPSSIPDTTKGAGYFSNAAVSESIDNESVWSSVGGQPSTTADSGYFKADGGISSVREPQDLAEDFDLFQDTFNDSNSTMSTDFFQSKQQSLNPSSTSGYYTSQGTTPSQSSSLGTTKPAAQPSSYSTLTSSTYSTSTSMGTSSFSTASYPPISTSSQVLDTTNNQDEDYDLGEPVDLLSDLADEPYSDGSNFQTSYSAAQSTSSGYYHADQTTPAMSTSTAYFSTSSSVNGNGYPPFDSTAGNNLGGDNFGDDDNWLPPLPDEDDLGGVPTSFGGSFVTHSSRKS